MRIVSGWPRQFDAQRARSLGFRADESFAQIVRVHIEDELGGRIATVPREAGNGATAMTCSRRGHLGAVFRSKSDSRLDLLFNSAGTRRHA